MNPTPLHQYSPNFADQKDIKELRALRENLVKNLPKFAKNTVKMKEAKQIIDEAIKNNPNNLPF